MKKILRFFKKKQKKYIVKTQIAVGFEAIACTVKIRWTYVLNEHNDGSRTVEKFFSGEYDFSEHDEWDYSMPARIKAWENGEEISEAALLDLSFLPEEII